MIQCLMCDLPAHGGRFAWRGWYRFRCANGHRFKLATPAKAAQNWREATKATRGTEAS